MKRIYCDYAATTPLDKDVEKAMRPFVSHSLSGGFGNPSSLHWFGQGARAVIDSARDVVVKNIGAKPEEVIFTGSATEANNHVLRKAVCLENQAVKKKLKPKIIVSATEHESVLDTVRDLQKKGNEIVFLPVDGKGCVDLKKLKENMDERTALVSVMYANNETGTVQPITDIALIIREFRNLKSRKFPLFHTDAVQAFQFLDCNVEDLGVDFMTLSSHKIYGPKGIGGLYMRTGTGLNSFITGGGQEHGLRSGTENVAGIAGFARAVELVCASRKKEAKRLWELSQRFLAGVKKIGKGIEVNGFGFGDFSDGQQWRLPNIVNLYFEDMKTQDMLTAFDINGIAVSGGSACKAMMFESSHVLKAMGFSEKRAGSSLRFSFGRFTNSGDISVVLNILRRVMKNS